MLRDFYWQRPSHVKIGHFRPFVNQKTTQYKTKKKKKIKKFCCFFLMQVRWLGVLAIYVFISSFQFAPQPTRLELNGFERYRHSGESKAMAN
jgi:hypothetical protein